MKCYVLMRCMDLEDVDESGSNTHNIEWAVPSGQKDLITVFISNSIGSIKKALVEFIGNLEPGRYHHAEKDGYHLYARLLGRSCFALATDTALTEKQLNNLCRYTLLDQLPLQVVANDCAGYTVNRETQTLKDTLAETTEIVKNNFIKAEYRGELLEELAAKAAILEQEAIIFHHEAKELNRCWPNFCPDWFSLPSLPWPFK